MNGGTGIGHGSGAETRSGRDVPTRQAEILASTHTVDFCDDDGEAWNLVCSCGWEAWGFASEDAVRAVYSAHVLDPLADRPVTVLS